jgi:drug/metabolite transporter (DMT)-like permease
MLGEALALASALFLGLSSALVKNLTPRVNAVYLATLRLVTSALLAVGTAAAVGQLGSVVDVPQKTLIVLAGAAVIMMIGHVFLVKAIELDDISRVLPATTGIYILLSVIFSILLADGGVSTLTVVGGSVVLGGVYLLSRRPDQDLSRPGRAFQGSGLMALGFASGTSLAWTIGVMVMDDVVNIVEPIPAAAIRMSFMALILVGITALTGDIRRRSRSGLDMSVASVSGVLLGASTLTFTAALKWSAPATVVILNSTAPLFVVPIAITWLHERITRTVAMGTVACFVGVVLTSL